MPENLDIRVKDCELYFRPVTMKMPLKFGAESVTGYDYVTVLVKMKVCDRRGKEAVGWGEITLSPSGARDSECGRRRSNLHYRKRRF